MQDCLLRAFRAYDSLQNPVAAGRWLRAILVNAFPDRLRKQLRTVEETSLDEAGEDFSLYRTIAEEDPFPYSDSLHLDFLACFGEDDVRAVLLRLSPLYRAPLVLRVHGGLRHLKRSPAVEPSQRGAQRHLQEPGRKLFEREMWAYAQAHNLLDAQESSR